VSVERIAGLVDWPEALPFTEMSAREAAHIRRELREANQSLGTADVLIAADARRVGATLVTADTDFGAVDDLSVRTFR
jgi:tRNA(fMet)-specific endonuclease VapC